MAETEYKKLNPNPDFQGPEKNRKCTDILIALLLIASWVGTTYIGYVGHRDGRIDVLTHGMQYDGQLCGEGNLEDKPFLYYVRFDGTGVCVDSCPSSGNEDPICLPTDVIPEQYRLNPPATLVVLPSFGQGYCMNAYKSTPVLGHCVFSDASLVEKFASTSSSSQLAADIQDFLEDCETAKKYILGIGIGVSVLLGFLYLLLLRIPCVINVLVWGSILAIEAFVVVLAYLLYRTAHTGQVDGTLTHTRIIASYSISGILAVLGLVWICLVCFLRKEIILAEDVVVEASKPVSAMPALFLWPLLQVFGIVLFLIPFAIVCVYTASLGTMVDTVDANGFHHKSFAFDKKVEYFAMFLLFEFFWTTQFVIAMGQIVIALSVAQWYFVRDKSEIGLGTVCAAIWESFFFHMGTAAFGALLMAIVLWIRAMLLYFQKKAEVAKENQIVKAVLCCCQCCLWCLETCIKFVNKNAYIQTAIFSSGFCESCVESFHLITRNLARLGMVTVVTEFILFIMQAFISLLSTLLAYRLLQYYLFPELNTLLGPTALVFAFSWFISTQFREIFGMAILTILHCFVADEEMNCETPDNCYAEGTLKEFMKEFHAGHGEHRKLLQNK